MTEREQIIAELVGRAGVIPTELVGLVRLGAERVCIAMDVKAAIAALQAKHEAVVSEQALRYLALDTQFDEMVAEKYSEIAKYREDAARFKWVFMDTPKDSVFMLEFHEGVKDGWYLDRWRMTIDAAIARSKG